MDAGLGMNRGCHRGCRQGRSRGERAFTLAEVLASVVLLAAALVPVIQAISSSQATGTRSQRATRSLFFAEQRIEQIRNAALQSFNDDFSDTGEHLGDGFFCIVVDEEVNALLKRISVMVGFDADGSGDLDDTEIDVVLDTQIARRMGG